MPTSGSPNGFFIFATIYVSAAVHYLGATWRQAFLSHTRFELIAAFPFNKLRSSLYLEYFARLLISYREENLRNTSRIPMPIVSSVTIHLFDALGYLL
jgi:hypothetical protein